MTVRKRVVICGGHPSWLTAMRKMVDGNIKYIESERFDVSVLRNADMVLCQNNAISHKAFYRVVNECRRRDIPLRYFASASATKCVEQMKSYGLLGG